MIRELSLPTRLKVALTAGLLAIAAWMLPVSARRPRQTPWRCACWYWRRPFHLTEAERLRLRAARIERLYVYAGTLIVQGDGLRLVRRQQWQSAPPCEWYAVVRVHPAANGALLSSGAEAQVARLLGNDAMLRSAAGIQWDADIPTARLDDYTRFLHRFRRTSISSTTAAFGARSMNSQPQPHQVRQLAGSESAKADFAPWLPWFQPPGVGSRSRSASQALSITALPDWLSSPEYPSVCDAVDEIAPQFYGNRWPEPGQPPPPLWETRGLLAAVRRSVRGRARVWVGLPAYGRCVVTDERGRPLGVRHDLDPERLLEDPAWAVEESTTLRQTWQPGEASVPVEDTLVLRCRESTDTGPMTVPEGALLWFQWPRVDGLRSLVQQLRARRPAGVEGVCFFRWPAPDEPLAQPDAVTAAVASTPPAGGIEARFRRLGRSVQVQVENQGLDSPLLNGGITVEVRTPREAEVSADAPVAWDRAAEPASRLRADRAVFSRPLLRPGHCWEVCDVARCDGPSQVTLRWQSAAGVWQTRVFHEPARPSATATARWERGGNP